MSEQVKIAYEKHPVSPERKAKLIKDGFKIIDIRFKPAGETKSGKKGGKKDAELDNDDDNQVNTNDAQTDLNAEPTQGESINEGENLNNESE